MRFMDDVGSRASDGADDSGCGAAVLRGGVGGDDCELLQCVHSDVPSEHTSGASVRVVVDVTSVKQVAVLLGTSSSDAELPAEAALHAVGRTDGRLGLDDCHARGEGGEISPGTSVQRKFTHGIATDEIGRAHV